MSREQAREVQRQLRVMNRRGAIQYFEGLSSTLLVESLYVLPGTGGENWELLILLGGGDFVEYAGVSSGSSVRGGTFRDIVITAKTNDKHEGEQITGFRATRIDPDGEEIEKVEFKTAMPELVGEEQTEMMRVWRKARGMKRKYFDEGEKRIVREYVPEHEFILS